MVLSEAPRELHGEADGKAPRASRHQPEDGACLSPQGGLPTLLELQQCRLGWPFPRRVVHTHHALTHRADEEGGQDVARSPRPPAQLVPGQKADRAGCRRRLKQQSESDYEKSLRLQKLQRRKSGVISYTWKPARTGGHPQLLLVRQKFLGSGIGFLFVKFVWEPFKSR